VPLFDDSDAHLTERLEVSVHGLKKLWRGIYERIEDRMPEFFGDTASDDDGKRGPEKRRPVLAYVRQRPEGGAPDVAACATILVRTELDGPRHNPIGTSRWGARP
jgi:hypothetical protein